MSFPSFRRSVYATPAPENLNSPSILNGQEDAEILKLYKGKDKYRADVRLMSGPILKKVRLAGAFYSTLGYLHGHKTAYMVGQRVKIVFLENRRDLFVADAVYSLPAGLKETTNLDLAEYDPEEVSTGHESGHKTVWDDGKVKFQDKLKRVFLEIDYDTEEIILKTSGKVTVESNNIKLKTNLSNIEISDSSIKTEIGSNSIEISNSEIKMNAPRIKVTNGVIEFDLLTHLHTSSAPGNPNSTPIPGS